MANDAGSLKKVAVLTGLTMVIGGAEVSTAGANTIITPPQSNTAFSIVFNGSGPVTANPSPTFGQFNPSLGNLTSVDFSLDSNISSSDTGANFTATITVDVGGQIVPLQPSRNTLGTYDVDFSGLVGAANAAFYTGTGSFPVTLTLNQSSEFSMTWDGETSPETGLTLTYDYVPLPAALPMFATGLGGLGLAAWRSRRKQKRG